MRIYKIEVNGEYDNWDLDYCGNMKAVVRVINRYLKDEERDIEITETDLDEFEKDIFYYQTDKEEFEIHAIEVEM